MIKNNQNKYNQLRKEYNVFIYERFDYVFNKDSINICYTFNLADKFVFKPELIIHIDESQRNSLDSFFLDNLVFQLGMIELVSYWKSSCAPNIIVKPFCLNDEQLKFWKKLYFNGLGEFFYLNGIQTGIDDFVSISSQSKESPTPSSINTVPDKVLVPVGGGKDSVVSLEYLKDNFKVIPFIVNPRGASTDTIINSGFGKENIVHVTRVIHPQLLNLNDLGFLNGHTPFSAVLAFITLIVSSFLGIRYVALSNESSANEPTIENGPNHQYSKSIEFEKDFREYCHKYISPDLQYFSFLRPLSEYRIANMFSKFSSHLKIFKSCNVGSKTNSWCGTCSKCLFTAIILSPFLKRETIINIFEKDILNDENLTSIFNELSGITQNKPFECVGTVNEVNIALLETVHKIDGDLPFLLKYYKDSQQYSAYKDQKPDIELALQKEHYLPDSFYNILIRHLNE